MRVLAVVIESDAGPGVFAEEALARRVVIDEWSGASARRPRGRWDGLVVLGGTMQVDDSERHPWMADVLSLIDDAVASEVPVLGVCLGGQMLAAAAGGEVGPAPEPEIGWRRVELRPAGADDAVMGPLAPEFVVYQDHSYAFAVPPGAESLAFSPVCEQAFRLGERAWGIQFHPEPSVSMLEGWIAAGSLAEEERRGLIDETRRRGADARRLGRAFFGRFLDVVAAADGATLALR